MYIYNTTFVIEQADYEGWLAWYREQYVAAVKAIEDVEVRTFSVEDMPNQQPGDRTVSCQCICANPTALGRVRLLTKKLVGAVRYLSFSSMMKEVEL